MKNLDLDQLRRAAARVVAELEAWARRDRDGWDVARARGGRPVAAPSTRGPGRPARSRAAGRRDRHGSARPSRSASGVPNTWCLAGGLNQVGAPLAVELHRNADMAVRTLDALKARGPEGVRVSAQLLLPVVSICLPPGRAPGLDAKGRGVWDPKLAIAHGPRRELWDPFNGFAVRPSRRRAR